MGDSNLADPWEISISRAEIFCRRAEMLLHPSAADILTNTMAISASTAEISRVSTVMPPAAEY